MFEIIDIFILHNSLHCILQAYEFLIYYFWSYISYMHLGLTPNSRCFLCVGVLLNINSLIHSNIIYYYFSLIIFMCYVS